MKREEINEIILRDVMNAIQDDFLSNNDEKTVIVLKDLESKQEVQLDYILSQTVFNIVDKYYNDCFEEDLKEFEELKEKQAQEQGLEGE